MEKPFNESSQVFKGEQENQVQYAEFLAFLTFLREIGNYDSDMIEASVSHGTPYKPIIPYPYDWHTWINLDWKDNGREALALYLPDLEGGAQGPVPDDHYLEYFLQAVLMPYFSRVDSISHPRMRLPGETLSKDSIQRAIYELDQHQKEKQRYLALNDLLVTLSTGVIESIINPPDEVLNIDYELRYTNEVLHADFIMVFVIRGGSVVKIGDSRGPMPDGNDYKLNADDRESVIQLMDRKEMIVIHPGELDPLIPEVLIPPAGSTHTLVPMLDDSSLVGAMLLGNCAPDDETNVAIKIIASILETALFTRFAKESLQLKNAELNSYAESLNHYNANLKIITNSSEKLFQCQDEDEFYRLTAGFISEVLPGQRGALYIYNAEQDLFSRAITWNDFIETPTILSAVDGLRLLPLNMNMVNGLIYLPLRNIDDLIGVIVEETPYDDSITPLEMQEIIHTLPLLIAEKVTSALANLRRVWEQTYHDPLTGVYNRRYYLKLANTPGAFRNGAMALLDIDDFRKVNDVFGHLAGDFILQELGNLLIHSFRTNDIVCRYGGDEFLVWMNGNSLQNARRKMEALRAKIFKKVFNYDGHSLRITISAGVIDSVDGMSTVPELVGRADELLFVSKRSGRNRITDALDMEEE